MTQKEFEILTGKEVSAEEYSKIEKVYMSTNSDKMAFCLMWSHTPEQTKEYMIEMARISETEAIATRQGMKTLTYKNTELLDVMFERAQRMSDPELRKECIKHMGAKEYIKRLIEGDYTLWTDDRKLLMTIL